jgi:hypothetical protein
MAQTYINTSQPVTASIDFERAPADVRLYSCQNGNLHYIRPNAKGLKHFEVNIPRPGKYILEGTAAVTTKPLEKRTYPQTLPPAERTSRPDPFLTYNPDVKHTPARIHKDTGELQICAGFMDLPNEVRYFILLHELGHFRYKTETYCDQYALKRFLDDGYNPSQAVIALTRILTPSEQNEERIKQIFNIIENGTKTKN